MQIQSRRPVALRTRAQNFLVNTFALAVGAALAAWAPAVRAVSHSSQNKVAHPARIAATAHEASGTSAADAAGWGEWATPWNAQLDARNFAISEKLDGVRALWDGKKLRFRSGRAIAAPAWFLAALPSEALDGELWMGRGSFDRLSGAVRKAQPVDEEWQHVRYMVFDAPAAGLSFSQRYQRAQDLVSASDASWLQVVAQAHITDVREVPERLQSIVASGGEGLVLHRWDATWRPGRSDAVRKLKLQPDEEGRVLALVPGKGKLKGSMGALLLETPDKKRFTLGTGFSENDRLHPPAIGSLVTYRYRDRTPQGLPRFASFLRVRGEE